MLTRCILALAVVCPLLAAPGARAQSAVDLELVLAVDASGSVDREEYALQLGGIAAAFRDRAVIDAIAAGPLRRIAVAMVVWADAHRAKDATGWWVIGTTAEALAFADFIESRPRRIRGGATGIASGIATAIAMIDANEISGQRLVVDVSGDGVENSSQRIVGDFVMRVPATRQIIEMRAIAEARGITINGLAILNEVPDLTDWYEANVRFGPDSFVMSADDYADFAYAIRGKLLREIGTGPAVSERRPSIPDRAGDRRVAEPERVGDHADG